jgi:hypothetical protein
MRSFPLAYLTIVFDAFSLYRKMINLVSNIRDISDSLPVLSGGVPGSVVEDEPDLAIFARDAEVERQPRARYSTSRRRRRGYDLNAMMFGRNMFLPRMQDVMMGAYHHIPSSDSEEMDFAGNINTSDDDSDSSSI